MHALLIITCVTALVLSFGCSLAEAVLLSLNPLRLKAQHRRGLTEAGQWLALKERIERPIGAILILNSLANTGLATVAGAIFVMIYTQQWLWAFSLGFTLLVLIGTEMVPKVIGVNHSERLAPFISPLLRFVMNALSPAIDLMEGIARRCTPRRQEDHERGDQIMDIITLTQAAKAEHLIHSYEEIIIVHAATLSARRVSSVMIPRESIRTLRDDLSIDDNLELACEALFTRYPVSAGESIDEASGYVNVKELACRRRVSPAPLLCDFIHPLLSVSPSTSLTSLLALLFHEKEQFALVRELSGRVVGLVTLDDVVQLIIGDKL